MIANLYLDPPTTQKNSALPLNLSTLHFFFGFWSIGKLQDTPTKSSWHKNWKVFHRLAMRRGGFLPSIGALDRRHLVCLGGFDLFSSEIS